MGNELINRTRIPGTFPEIGRRAPEPDSSEIREIIYRSYRIYYRIKPGQGAGRGDSFLARRARFPDHSTSMTMLCHNPRGQELFGASLKGESAFALAPSASVRLRTHGLLHLINEFEPTFQNRANMSGNRPCYTARNEATAVTNASCIPLTGHWSPHFPFLPCPDRFTAVALVTDGWSKR